MTTSEWRRRHLEAATVLVGTMLCVLLGFVPARAQAPWLTAELRAITDNQPRDALRLRIEHGRYFGPDVTLAAHVAGERIEASATAELGATSTLGVPAALFGVALTGSTLLGAPTGVIPLLADLRASLGIGGDVTLKSRFSRQRYTATLSSIDTLVLEQAVELVVDRAGNPGWAGELLVRRAVYGDDNQVVTAYAWALAPLSRSARHSIRAGYSAAWQDAAKSTWAPDEGRRFPPRGPPTLLPDTVQGHYAPYYTPHDLVTHSVLANAAVQLGVAWLILNGSYGVHATELAPVLVRTATGAVELQFGTRSFSPHRANAMLSMPLGAATSLTLDAEHVRTAYYRQAGVRIAFGRSFGGR